MKKVKTLEAKITMIFHVTLETSEDGWIIAECPALPGCVSQGKDEKEALENIKELSFSVIANVTMIPA